jgi:hypothetical protein
MKDILKTSLNKRALAARYQVGVRTIETWLAARLITGARRGRSLQFDPLACDTSLLALHDVKELPTKRLTKLT